jgi:hypothetical protein
MTPSEQIEAQATKVKAAKDALEHEAALLKQLVEQHAGPVVWPQPRA